MTDTIIQFAYKTIAATDNSPEDKWNALVDTIENPKIVTIKKCIHKNKYIRSDPMTIKRPTSSYMRWLNANRAAIKTEHFGEAYEKEHGPLQGRDKVTFVAKKAGELWKALSDDDKAPYIEAYEIEKAKYKKMISHGNDKIIAMPSKKKMPIYDGPHQYYHLGKIIVDPFYGVTQYYSLNDAMKVAAIMGSKCGGITEEYSMFSLREGKTLHKALDTYRQSWVKIG
jgi:hypothetical protein